MHITHLRLRHFKAHDDLEIEPASGLTIIRGPNEAGKSTIQQAIELVLYRKADANREDVRRAWTWGSSTPPEVALDFASDGRDISLLKRFGGQRSEAELTIDGDSVTDFTLIQDQIAEITGVPTEAFFRATASVGHAELDAVSADEPLIGDRLQRAISGADRGTAKAKKKLEAAVHRYRTEGHKNPGLLKVVRGEIAELEAELATGEAALVRLQSDRAQWVEAHERRESLDVTLRRQKADLAEAERAAAVARQRDEAQERYDRLARAADLTEEADRVRRSAPSSMPLAQLLATAARADNLQFELSELEAGVDIAAEAAETDEAEGAPARPLRWLGLATLFVLLGWAAALTLGDAGAIGVIVILVLAIGVVASLLQAVRGARRRRQYGLAMRLAEGARAQRADAERAQEEQSRRTRRELEGLLESLGVGDVEAAGSLVVEAQEQTESLASIEGELRGLGVDEGNLRRLEEARDQAANETQRAMHALAAMGSVGEAPQVTLEAAQKQVAKTAPARDAARSEEDQAQGRVDANLVDAELVAGLAERLAAARERLAELERRMHVYLGTLAAIEAAEQATLKTAARYLEERMGPTMAAITDGRYDDVKVDERNLDFKARVPETGELVDSDRLSQGTQDQLFLSARLGLVRLVTMDRRPPLILDDPFTTFDRARGERALRLIKDFAVKHGFQVLYLTCTDRFDALADKLVTLPAPSRERVLAAPKTPAATRPIEDSGETSRPTLVFEPDHRPGPDPLAPLRKAAEEASEAERETGVADPFRLGQSDGNEAGD